MEEKEPDMKPVRKERKKDEDFEEITPEDAVKDCKDSIIIKIRNDSIDDILTYLSIEDTMAFLMLAPLEFIQRTEGAENEKEFKELMWKQVRAFYREARDLLDKRYRL